MSYFLILKSQVTFHAVKFTFNTLVCPLYILGHVHLKPVGDFKLKQESLSSHTNPHNFAVT